MTKLTLPQQRALARFRRGPANWSRTAAKWKMADGYHVPNRVMAKLAEYGLVAVATNATYPPTARVSLTPKGRGILVAIPHYCRHCGGDDEHARDGGCPWVEPDLCSACHAHLNRKEQAA